MSFNLAVLKVPFLFTRASSPNEVALAGRFCQKIPIFIQPTTLALQLLKGSSECHFQNILPWGKWVAGRRLLTMAKEVLGSSVIFHQLIQREDPRWLYSTADIQATSEYSGQCGVTNQVIVRSMSGKYSNTVS